MACHEKHTETLCPSARPDMDGARVFGLVLSTPEMARTAYLDDVRLTTPEMLTLAGPVQPNEIFRIAAPCDGHACQHFDGAKCQLAQRIVQILPAVADNPPPCHIRTECLWWKQEGRAACVRCPQIQHEIATPSTEMVIAAGAGAEMRNSSRELCMRH
jgi:hypothetical protein